MKKIQRYLLLAVILVLLTSVVPFGTIYAQYKPPHDRPGPAVDRLKFKAFHVDIAPASLKAGDMDLYIYSLKIAAAKTLLNDPTVKVFEAPATMLSIVLNPAPAPEGELNPLSIREVRFALQYLIDRDFVAKVIYKGMAVPMTTHVSPLDYDYLTIYDLVKQYNIRYDSELAKKMITDALTKKGAILKEGHWYYNNKRIELKFVIRVEDERREAGDMVRAKLDELGFFVVPVYQTFGPATFTVYSTDPQSFTWHLYTEGWSRSAVEKYDSGTINQMCAPWLGNMPGWQEVGFWQYKQPELDQLGQRIFTGDFKNLEERNELYKKATKLSIDESVRLWVATVMNSFPAAKNLQGVTEDLTAGPKALWTLREAYIPGKTELTVGSLWVWTERTTWNPVGGFGDTYSTDIWRNVYDPPLWRHPFTGIPMPFRVEYQVETAGPTGKLDVPNDAVMWDANADEWREVGTGIKATSKATFDYTAYFTSKWHHGQPITMADVIYSIYQGFEMVYDKDKSKIEPAIAVTSKPYLDTFKGFKILDKNRLEVYVNFWHFEKDYIAEYATPAGLSMPWEILASMDDLVFIDRKAAYSDTAAEKFNVPWLSLVMDRDARLVANNLNTFLGEATMTGITVPEKVFAVINLQLTSADEASRRYRAAIDWFNQYGILVISNGPFRLVRYNPPAQYAELEAFRDPTYPFKPGKWYYGSANLVEIVEVSKQTIDIGSESKIAVKLRGPGQLGLRYLLSDPATGAILRTGDGEKLSPLEFTIRLPSDVTAKLKPGSYQLSLAVYSNEISFIAERIEFIEAGTGPSKPVVPGPLPGVPEERGIGISPITIGLAVTVSVVAVALGWYFLRKRMKKAR